MSEYFLKLDPYNYDSEVDMLLEKRIFTLSDWKEVYDSSRITDEEWERVLDYFSS